MTEERVSLERLSRVPNNVAEATAYQVLGLDIGRQLTLTNTNTETKGWNNTKTKIHYNNKIKKEGQLNGGMKVVERRRRYKQAERPPVLPRTTYTTLSYPFQTIFAEHTYTVQEGTMISLLSCISSWINEVKGKRARTYS